MPRKFQYVSLDRVIAKVYRDLGLEEISEIDLIEWSGEALEFIGAVSLYEQAVTLLNINNYQAELPNGLHSIIQVARNNNYKKATYNSKSGIDLDNSVIVQHKQHNCNCDNKNDNTDTLPKYLETCNCNFNFNTWLNSSNYRQNFTPVRLANHTFFNSLVCYENYKLYEQFCGADEYTVVNNMLRVSFKTGQVALAYYRQKVDKETGYPLIPDDVSIINAIYWYIAWKYNNRLWFLGREGYGDKMQYAETQWQWYCKQASNNLKMLYGIDEHQNMLESRMNFIPDRKKYYSFFGKLGKEENLKFRTDYINN